MGHFTLDAIRDGAHALESHRRQRPSHVPSHATSTIAEDESAPCANGAEGLEGDVPAVAKAAVAAFAHALNGDGAAPKKAAAVPAFPVFPPLHSTIDGAPREYGGGGGYLEEEEAYGAPDAPDRQELRDQLEWDLGIAETLYAMKQLQIAEQIGMEKRGARDDAKASRAQRRRSSVDAELPVDPKGDGRRRSSMANARRGSRETVAPKKMGVDFKLQDELRSKSRRALFEGLANTADMSRDRWYIVRSEGNARSVWTTLVSVSTVVTVIVAPLISCGVLYEGPTTQGVAGTCDLLFVCDVLLTFVTAYQDSLRDIVVTSPRHIRARYLQGMFTLDALSATPFDWIMRASGASDAAVDALRMCKLVRMYRMGVSTTEADARNLGDTAINPSLLSLLKLVASLFLIWHWTACLYILISVRTNAAGAQAPIFDTREPWVPPASVLLGSAGVRYAYAASWAIGTTCLTMRPEPNTLVQLVFGDTITVLGFITMAGIVGSATTAISEIQAQRSEATRLLQTIARYMRRKHLPANVRRRVLSYYRFHQTSMNILDHESVLVGLPRAMRMQISLIMHKPIFVQLPLFWLCAEEEMLLIVQRLKPCLVMPGEMLVKEGTLGVGLFLLMKGAVETTRNGKMLVVLLAVAAFGESALLSDDEPSSVTVRALRFCEASVLYKEDWACIEQINPQIRTWLNIYIAERDKHLQDENVQQQSAQTKKATIRCGGGMHSEWSDFGSGLSSGRRMRARAIGAAANNAWRRVAAHANASRVVEHMSGAAAMAKTTRVRLPRTLARQGTPDESSESGGSSGSVFSATRRRLFGDRASADGGGGGGGFAMPTRATAGSKGGRGALGLLHPLEV